MHPYADRDRIAIPVCAAMHPCAVVGLESGQLDLNQRPFGPQPVADQSGQIERGRTLEASRARTPPRPALSPATTHVVRPGPGGSPLPGAGSGPHSVLKAPQIRVNSRTRLIAHPRGTTAICLICRHFSGLGELSTSPAKPRRRPLDVTVICGEWPMLGELGDRHTCPDLRRGERVPKIVRNQALDPSPVPRRVPGPPAPVLVLVKTRRLPFAPGEQQPFADPVGEHVLAHVATNPVDQVNR